MTPDQETSITWNKIAALYEEKFMDLDLYNQSYDAFCSLLKQNPTVLEIGCGPGNITKYLLAKIPDIDLLGIDYAPNMIELAKKNNPTAQFRVLDTREINTIKQKFDAIMIGFCVPYLSKNDCTVLVKNCADLLNTNGIIYISFVEGDEKDSGYKTSNSGDRVFFNYHNLKHLQGELNLNGFSTHQVFKVDYPKKDSNEIHSIVIGQKNLEK